MVKETVQMTLVAASIALGASAAQANNFATLNGVSAQPLTASEMKSVEAKAHIYLLVENRGVELPAQGEAATRAAAPTPKNLAAGNSPAFARSPSRDAAAFDVLN